MFNGDDITALDITERARLGIGVSQQRPPTIAGVKLRQILDFVIANAPQRAQEIDELVRAFQMEPFLERDVNAGLSGGEIKRSELFQLLATRPRFVMMDEPDSGVDLEAMSVIGEMTNELLARNHATRPTERRAGLIITHTGHISLRPARSIQTNPRTWLNGEGASVKYLTIILGSQGSTIDTGGDVYLNGENTSVELAHRAVCTGGRIYQRGLLVGNAPGCRAHVDCAGMVLDAGEDGFIEAVPGLRALHPEARMSHEASIGKIAPEQVTYLQSRGMEKREAISLIIRGFLDADIEGLSPELDARIAEIAELAGHGE